MVGRAQQCLGTPPPLDAPATTAPHRHARHEAPRVSAILILLDCKLVSTHLDSLTINEWATTLIEVTRKQGIGVHLGRLNTLWWDRAKKNSIRLRKVGPKTLDNAPHSVLYPTEYKVTASMLPSELAPALEAIGGNPLRHWLEVPPTVAAELGLPPGVKVSLGARKRAGALEPSPMDEDAFFLTGARGGLMAVRPPSAPPSELLGGGTHRARTGRQDGAARQSDNANAEVQRRPRTHQEWWQNRGRDNPDPLLARMRPSSS